MEKEDLVEITEAEFLKYISKTIDTCEDEIQSYESTMKIFQRLYRDYLIDKEDNKLKYYLQGNTLMYDKVTGSNKIGYKYNMGREGEQHDK